MEKHASITFADCVEGITHREGLYYTIRSDTIRCAQGQAEKEKRRKRKERREARDWNQLGNRELANWRTVNVAMWQPVAVAVAASSRALR